MTSLVIVLWLIAGEVLASGVLGAAWKGLSAADWAASLTPLRAIFAAVEPVAASETVAARLSQPVTLFMLAACAGAAVLNLIAIARVRVWNPTRELQPQSSTDEAEEVDIHASGIKVRHVWDNPILWREVCTWAYGKKILLVRIAYLVVFVVCTAALVSLFTGEQTAADLGADPLPAAKPIVALIVVGLLLVNALAVTSLTNERDLRALDLLLVTDLSPKEIVFGKLGGIFYNSKEIILLPLVMAGGLWFTGYLGTENLIFLTITMLVMNAFVAMLGVHSGMTYANSRTAVGVSLGTLLFLLLGIAICMRMMLAFQSSFSYQLQAFSAFMVGGGIGLYCALGMRNPSRAIFWASLVAPFATFFVITSFLNQSYGAAFLVTVATYGFTIAAMLVPAIYEFDVATGRTTTHE